MHEPRHMRTLAAWIAAHGARCEVLRYARPKAHGEVRAVRIAPGQAARGHVVFAHATGNDAVFPQLTLIKALVAAGLEVFAFDLDGHGRVSTTALDVEHVTSALPEAIAASGWNANVHVIGQSLGAGLALNTAASAATKKAVRSLTLVSVPIVLDVGASAALAELTSVTRGALWRQIADYGITGIIPAFGSVKRREYPVRLAANAAASGFDYYAVVKRVFERLALREAAPSVTAPTLVVAGTRDRIAAIGDARAIARLIPRAKLLEAAGETHFTTLLSEGVCAAIARHILDS